MADVYFKFGTMNSGKTAKAMMLAFDYEDAGVPPLCISPKLNDRDSSTFWEEGFLKTKWKTRFAKTEERIAYVVDAKTDIKWFKYDLDNFFSNRYYEPFKYKVIIIDEVQFLTTKQVEQLFELAVYDDVTIICYGLLTMSDTLMFDASKRLLELGAKFSEEKAVGTEGKRVVINAKIINGELITDVASIDTGGEEKYKALTLKEFWDMQKEIPTVEVSGLDFAEDF